MIYTRTKTCIIRSRDGVEVCIPAGARVGLDSIPVPGKPTLIYIPLAGADFDTHFKVTPYKLGVKVLIDLEPGDLEDV